MPAQNDDLGKVSDKPGGTTVSDLYREAGYLYRHSCKSRTAVLAVTMPLIFSMAWLLIYADLPVGKQMAVAAFGILMVGISMYTDRFYVRRILFITAQMEEMELRGEKRSVHLDIDALIQQKRIPSHDGFTNCLRTVVAAGFILLLFLYPDWWFYYK